MMTPALMKMWISLSSMGFMFIAIILIYLSRFKLKQKILKVMLQHVFSIFIIIRI